MSELSDWMHSTHIVGHLAPLNTESPASWLTRVAARQLVTPKEVAEYFGILYGPDFDLNFLGADLVKTAGLAGVPIAALKKMKDTMAAFRTCRAAPILSADRKPAYRYCDRCLQLDEVGYFRVAWRYQWYPTCLTHNRPLQQKCGSCGHFVVLPTTLQDVAQEASVPCSLKYCQVCGNLLAASADRPADASTSRTEVQFAYLRTLRLLNVRVEEGETLYALHALVSRGFTGRHLNSFIQYLAGPQDIQDVFRAIGVRGHLRQALKRGTLNLDGALPFEVSDRLWRLADLLAAVEMRLGSRSKAKHWLLNPNPILEGRSPVEIANTTPGLTLLRLRVKDLSWKP